MPSKRKSRLFFNFALAAILSSCTCPISDVYRKEARPDVDFSSVHSNPAAYRGTLVIWGGEILRTVNSEGKSDIIVLETPLDQWEKPVSDVHSRGRFIVQDNRFLDPAVFAKGRKITVAGVMIGEQRQRLGRTSYTYPLIRANQIHLWEESGRTIIVNNDGYWDDFDDWLDPGPYTYYGDGAEHEGFGGHDFDRDQGFEHHEGYGGHDFDRNQGFENHEGFGGRDFDGNPGFENHEGPGSQDFDQDQR
jgi:outer membrane lipoprotein